MSVTQIAAELGVPVRTIHGWISRYPDFPPPVDKISNARLFDIDQVRAWRKSIDLSPGAANPRYGTYTQKREKP